jgi:ricin-type beta-trefoil lectin protein
MRIRTLTALAATVLAGVAATAPSALAASPHDYDNAVLQIKTHTGLAVDVSGASTANGAPVIEWTQTFGDNQRFRFVRVKGHHQIRSVHSGKCLTVAGATSGAPVVQRTCHRALASQQWDVELGTPSSDVLNGLVLRSVSTGLPLTSAESATPGRQLTVNQSLLGDDPAEIFDFTTSVR